MLVWFWLLRANLTLSKDRHFLSFRYIKISKYATRQRQTDRQTDRRTCKKRVGFGVFSCSKQTAAILEEKHANVYAEISILILGLDYIIPARHFNDKNPRTLFSLRNAAAPGGRFSKAPETFRARKAIAKSLTLRFQSCFIHIF